MFLKKSYLHFFAVVAVGCAVNYIQIIEQSNCVSSISRDIYKSVNMGAQATYKVHHSRQHFWDNLCQF